MNKCPECESEQVVIHHDFPHQEPYGTEEQAMITFEAPALECSDCGLLYDSETTLKIREEVIAKYRRVFSKAA